MSFQVTYEHYSELIAVCASRSEWDNVPDEVINNIDSLMMENRVLDRNSYMHPDKLIHGDLNSDTLQSLFDGMDEELLASAIDGDEDDIRELFDRNRYGTYLGRQGDTVWWIE